MVSVLILNVSAYLRRGVKDSRPGRVGFHGRRVTPNRYRVGIPGRCDGRARPAARTGRPYRPRLAACGREARIRQLLFVLSFASPMATCSLSTAPGVKRGTTRAGIETFLVGPAVSTPVRAARSHRELAEAGECDVRALLQRLEDLVGDSPERSAVIGVGRLGALRYEPKSPSCSCDSLIGATYDDLRHANLSSTSRRSSAEIGHFGESGIPYRHPGSPHLAGSAQRPRAVS